LFIVCCLQFVLWQKNPKLREQKRSPSFLRELCADVFDAAAAEDICATSIFAASAFANLRKKERFLAYENHRGKKDKSV